MGNQGEAHIRNFKTLRMRMLRYYTAFSSFSLIAGCCQMFALMARIDEAMASTGAIFTSSKREGDLQQYQIIAISMWGVHVDLTGMGAVSSAFGRLFADALASNSFSSSRIAAALALSSSGDGGIGSAEVCCRDDLGSKPGRAVDAGKVMTKELPLPVSHSADQTNRATFIEAVQRLIWAGAGAGVSKRATAFLLPVRVSNAAQLDGGDANLGGRSPDRRVEPRRQQTLF